MVYAKNSHHPFQPFQYQSRSLAKTTTTNKPSTRSCCFLVGTTCTLILLLRWIFTLFTALHIYVHHPSIIFFTNDLSIFPFDALQPPQQKPSSSFQSQSQQQPTAHNGYYKLAVVVTGLFHRYVFQSSMERFVRPLSRQGHLVDYYVSLSMKQPPAYRSDQNYMNHQVSDPIFDHCIYQEEEEEEEEGNNRRTLLDEHDRKRRIRSFLHQQLKDSGGNLQYMTFQDNYLDMDANVKVIQHRRQALQMYPKEDPDLRFPTLDLRYNRWNRTANANRNMLHLFYHLQHLYEQVLIYELEVRVTKYDYVIFLRDDTMWFNNFDFQSMMDSSIPVSLFTSNNHIELFVPSCDARIPPMHPMEMNDHIVIVKRERADLYGKYFDELFRTNMVQCAQRLNNELQYGQSVTSSSSSSLLGATSHSQPSPLRGCNSEMILKYVLEINNVTIQAVGQGMIPFQRIVFVKDPITSNIHTCFHYYCQSQQDPLIIPSGIKQCTDIS